MLYICNVIYFNCQIFHNTVLFISILFIFSPSYFRFYENPKWLFVSLHHF